MRLSVCLSVCLSLTGRGQFTILGNDGLDSNGTCCSPVTAISLPVFNTFILRGRYLSMMDCLSLLGTTDVSLTIGPPVVSMTSPDLFTQTWTIAPVGGGTPFTTIVLTNVRLKYARTWYEIDRLGQMRQIWRFLVNVRINFDDMDATPFPRPPCDDLPGVSNFGGAWFAGFLDYASEPEGVVEGRAAVSLVVSHEPGCLNHEPLPAFNNQHIPATNTVPRHEPYSYHLVAPSGGFTPTTGLVGTPSTGDIDIAMGVVHSYRTIHSLLAPQLSRRIGVFNVHLSTMMRNCACTTVPGAVLAYWHQYVGSADPMFAPMTSDTFCTGSSGLVLLPFASGLNATQFLPTGFQQHLIGQWSLPDGTWPEDRWVWTSGGVWTYTDSTCLFPPAQPDYHFVHGGTSLYPDNGAVIHLIDDAMSTDHRMATDLTNGLEFMPFPVPSQTPRVGIETWGISSWHFNQ